MNKNNFMPIFEIKKKNNVTTKKNITNTWIDAIENLPNTVIRYF